MKKFWLIPNVYYEAKHILVPGEERVVEKGEKEDENEEGNFRFSLSLSLQSQHTGEGLAQVKQEERETGDGEWFGGGGWTGKKDGMRESSISSTTKCPVSKRRGFWVYMDVWHGSPPPSLPPSSV